MIKKIYFKDSDNLDWDNFLKINFEDYLLFSSNFIEYESEYFKGENLTYYLEYLDQIALVKIYKANEKTYFSQIYFSEKTKYNLGCLKVLSKQILDELLNEKKPTMHLKEYIHSSKTDIAFSHISDKFILNPVFELWIKLNQDLNSIWANLRRRYRTYINKNKSFIEIKFPVSFNLKKYQDLHLKVSGRKTRSDITWEYQRDMFKNKELIVCEAYINNSLIAYSFFNITDFIAQYSSSVTIREYFKEYSVTHLMMWESIKKIKSLGISKIYLGFTRSVKDRKSKVDSINYFKSGFATEIKKSFIVENEDDEYFDTGFFK